MCRERPTIKVILARTSGDPLLLMDRCVLRMNFLLRVKEDLDYACENCPASTVNPVRRIVPAALRAEYPCLRVIGRDMLSDCQKAWELALANRERTWMK
ncbi:MAG: hypothetical protein ACLUVG_08530 [Phocaeicola vulgatus]